MERCINAILNLIGIVRFQDKIQFQTAYLVNYLLLYRLHTMDIFEESIRNKILKNTKTGCC